MSVSTETLMAYADGELDAAARAEVEEAMRDDPSIAERIAQFRRQRAKLEAAYAAELEEPVPERLLAVLRAPGPVSTVVDLERARGTARRRPRRVAQRYLIAAAASILIAVTAGLFAWQRSIVIRHVGDTRLAAGALASGLSDQLSGDAGSGKVRVGLSFLSKSGEYCRTFDVAGASPSAGLACRHDDEWVVRALARPQSAEAGAYRTAGTTLPPEILKAVQDEIAAEPLDRAGEIAARGARWHAVEPH
jgi:hypothetical protein